MIPDIFHRNGFTCRLMKRQGNVVMYSLTKYGRMSYEVMKVQTLKHDDDFTKRKAGTEFLPSSSQWGKLGWTFNSLKEAEQQFKAVAFLTKDFKPQTV